MVLSISIISSTGLESLTSESFEQYKFGALGKQFRLEVMVWKVCESVVNDPRVVSSHQPDWNDSLQNDLNNTNSDHLEIIDDRDFRPMIGGGVNDYHENLFTYL